MPLSLQGKKKLYRMMIKMPVEEVKELRAEFLKILHRVLAKNDPAKERTEQEFTQIYLERIQSLTATDSYKSIAALLSGGAEEQSENNEQRMEIQEILQQLTATQREQLSDRLPAMLSNCRRAARVMARVDKIIPPPKQ